MSRSDFAVVRRAAAEDEVLPIPDGVPVRLNAGELAAASMRGASRRIECIERGAINRNNPEVGKEWYQDQASAMAELAVAKFTGRYWDGMGGTYPDADVRGVEVRSTDWILDPHLRIYHRDKDDLPYVLVLTHKIPTLILVGYLYGRDGKQDRYWKIEKECFWVPYTALRTTLADLVV